MQQLPLTPPPVQPQQPLLLQPGTPPLTCHPGQPYHFLPSIY